MSADKPSMAVLKRTKGAEAAEAVIAEFIMAANDYFNLSSKMNKFQVELTSQLILEKYYFLKVDEIKICFRRAMSGEYGEIYNRLDGAVIFEWLKKYDAERTSLVVKANQEMSANLTETLTKTIDSETIKVVTDNLKHVLVDDIVKEEILEAKTIERKLSPFEKTVQDEWDKLSTCGSMGPLHFRMFKGVATDFTEYRQMRAEEEVLKHGAPDTNEIPPLSNC